MGLAWIQHGHFAYKLLYNWPNKKTGKKLFRESQIPHANQKKGHMHMQEADPVKNDSAEHKFHG